MKIYKLIEKIREEIHLSNPVPTIIDVIVKEEEKVKEIIITDDEVHSKSEKEDSNDEIIEDGEVRSKSAKEGSNDFI